MTFTYEQTRDNEQLRLLTPAIDAFITRYKNPAPSTSTCPRQTVFFFPGGMASRLVRARTKFQDGIATPQEFEYDTVWIDLNTLIDEWRYLEMHRDSAGGFRDKGDHIIVADGSAVSLLGCTPHDGLIGWCASNNVDLFVFGWDWRRRLDETASFFVDRFLPFFQARVTAAGCPGALTRFALIGHSFGGMIVNLILRGNSAAVANMTHAITVATPFYGYAGQVHRWFEGEPWLLAAWGPAGPFLKQHLIEVVSSLPGLYVLHFLDGATFGTGPAPTGPAGSLDFPPAGYPSMDQTTAGLRADPYNPQSSGALVRYPTNTGFDLVELAYAKAQFQQLASAMPPNLSQKFYNIRGVVTDAGQPAPSTVGSVTWAWIQPIFYSLFHSSPIVDGGGVPGDDTQPAWSAHLATNDSSRRKTVAASDIEHAWMMNHPSTLAEIASILCASGAAMNPPASSQPASEEPSDEDIVSFLRWLFEHRKRIKTRLPRLDDKPLLDMVPSPHREKLGGIARRIMTDIMRGPTQRKPRKPGGGASAAPAGHSPATKGKTRPGAVRPRKKSIRSTAERMRRKSSKK